MKTKSISELRIDRWKFGFVVEARDKCKGLYDEVFSIRRTEIAKDGLAFNPVMIKTTSELADEESEQWMTQVCEMLRSYCGKELEDRINSFDEKKCPFVMKKLHYAAENENKFGVKMIVYLENENQIHIVGHHEDVVGFCDDIIDMATRSTIIMSEYDMNLNDAKVFGLGSLFKKIQRSFPALSIHYIDNGDKVEIEGFVEDVPKARAMIEELIFSHTLVMKPLSARVVDFIKRKRSVRKFIKTNLELHEKTKDWKWCLDDKNLLIVGRVDTDVDASVITGLLHEKEHLLSDYEVNTVFATPSSKMTLKRIEMNHEAYMTLSLDIDNSQLVLLCTTNALEEVEAKISEFRATFIEKKKTFQIAEVSDYFSTHMKEMLENIKVEHMSECIDFKWEDHTLEIRGNQKGIHDVIQHLKTIEDSLQVVRLGTGNEEATFLQSEEGIRAVQQIEKDKTVIVRVKTSPELKIVQEKIEDQKV